MSIIDGGWHRTFGRVRRRHSIAGRILRFGPRLYGDTVFTTFRRPLLPFAVAAAACAAVLTVDLAVLNPRTPSGRLLLAELVLVPLLAALVCRDLRPHPWRAAVWGLSAAAVSLAVTAVVSGTVLQRTPGTTATGALAVIVVVGCRHLPTRRLLVVAPAVVAILAVPARLPERLLADLPGGAGALAAVVVCGCLAGGLLLRAGDTGRRAAHAAAIRGERLRLAHDLHDDVAHHVTGIVIAAQAGGLAVDDPERVRTLFARIEAGGQEGLTSMNRMVRLLRSGTDPAPTVEPSLDDVAELVHRFAATDVPASLHITPAARAGELSGPRCGLVGRVVQEGLTNVRKHARAARAVEVVIDRDDATVVVSVRDDGDRRPRNRRFPAGGAGLEGLSEQLVALDGELAAGPGDRGGWALTARIPQDRR